MEYPEYIKLLAEIVHDALDETAPFGAFARVDCGSFSTAMIFDAYLAVERNALTVEDRLLHISARMAFDFYEIEIDDDVIDVIAKRLRVDLLEFRREIADAAHDEPDEQPAQPDPRKLLN